jgi:hypothetical protein
MYILLVYVREFFTGIFILKLLKSPGQARTIGFSNTEQRKKILFIYIKDSLNNSSVVVVAFLLSFS